MSIEPGHVKAVSELLGESAHTAAQGEWLRRQSRDALLALRRAAASRYPASSGRITRSSATDTAATAPDSVNS